MMEISLIIAGLSAIAAIWAAISAHKSRQHSDESAKVAAEVLKLDKIKYEDAQLEQSRQYVDAIVSEGIQFFKASNHYKGLQRLVATHPGLSDRNDFREIVMRILGGSGYSIKDVDQFLNSAAFKKAQE